MLGYTLLGGGVYLRKLVKSKSAAPRGAALLICLLLFCAGCGGRPGIGKISKDSVVVAFGDSLTSGTGADKAQSYPAVLSDLMGCRVVNAGVAGEDTAAGLARLPSLLAKEEPDLVVLCHGGNDMLRHQDRDTTIRNLHAMLLLIKEARADAVLIGVPKPGLILKAPEFYQDIASRHRIPYEGGSIGKILSSPALKSDHAHPNERGYRKLAEAIAGLIRESQG